MTEPRKIEHTRHAAVHPWPDDTFIQGSERGMVFTEDGGYRTAFVEVFPAGTFIRGEGETVQEAEDSAWKQYCTWRDCDGTGQPHGPYEARNYTNGAGFCTRCGTWASKVLPVQPEKPRPREKQSLMERALGGDLGAALGVLDAMVSLQKPDEPQP